MKIPELRAAPDTPAVVRLLTGQPHDLSQAAARLLRAGEELPAQN